MHIALHQPFKAARRLGLPWYVQFYIIAAIVWMWICWRVFDFFNHCSSSFYPTDEFWIDWQAGNGELGYHDWNRKRHWITSVKFSFAQAEARLKEVSAIFTTCAGRRIQLACGCQQYIHWLTQDSPVETGYEPCDYCRRYHKAEPEKSDRHQDCQNHGVLFARWPEVRRHLYFWERELRPSQAGDLLYDGLKQNTLSHDRQAELCRIIAKSSFHSYRYATRSGLAPEFRELLASSVWRGWQAKQLLDKYRSAKLELGAAAVLHLERVIKIHAGLILTIRAISVLAAIVALIWHIPDLRTVVVLVVVAVTLWVFAFVGRWIK